MGFKTWLDVVAVVYAAVSIVYLIVIMVSLVVVRNKPFMAARGARFMAIMCWAGVVHIVAATVSHQHSTDIEALERQSCVLWGYWLPYMAVGLWFTCQYLQTLTYTAMLSRSFSERGARRLIFSRPLIGAFILIPPTVINLIVTFSPSVTYVDGDKNVCVSKIWAKLVVAGWIATCITVLASTLVWFRRSLARDAVRELPRQGVVLSVSVAAALAQAFVIVVASRGFDDVANRLVATVTIATMYTLSICILAQRPLWKIMHKNDGYQLAETEKLQTLQQPITSILTLMDRSADDPSTALVLIVADFLLWCSDPVRPCMDIGRGKKPTHPSGLTALYQHCDYFTSTKLGDRHDPSKTPYGNRMKGGFPPFVSAGDITRSARDICNVHFEPPHGMHAGKKSDVGQLDIPSHIVESVMASLGTAGREPDTIFVPLMWWILIRLDNYFGETYLTEHIMRRPIWEQNSDVRVALVEVLRKESRIRLDHAGVRFDAVRAGVRLEDEDEDDGPATLGVVELQDYTDSDSDSA